MTTIRTNLFKLAARVTMSVRRIVLHLSSYSPYQHLFADLVRRHFPSGSSWWKRSLKRGCLLSAYE